MNRNEEYLSLMKELEENTPDLIRSVRKAKNRRHRVAFAYRPLAGLAACFVLFVLLVNVSAPVAQACANVPFLRTLVESVTFSRSLSDAIENDYVQQPDLVQENNGIIAKIAHIIVDQKQVNIFYRLESEKHKAMYTIPKVLDKDGIENEPCTWRTPINDVANEELRLITLDYYDDEVPGSLQLVLNVYNNSQKEEEGAIAQFVFLLEFDSEFIADAMVYPVNQSVILDGQSITITNIEVYPTHLRVNTVDAADNTAWLKTLDFYIETEKGRFDIPVGGILATSTEEGSNSFRADSIYFYDAKEIKLVITGARWLQKDMEKVKIDLTTGQADALPEGVTLVPADTENAMRPVTLHIRWDWNENQHIMLGMVYYDTEGNRNQAPVCFRDCMEHDGNCWYEWLDLRSYPHDHIEVCLTYTHGCKAESPITIDIR